MNSEAKAREGMKKETVSWVNEVAVKEGALDTFRELMEEMVSGTTAEPGTLMYEWYISDDGVTVHVFEIYADSDAVVAHHVSEGFAMRNWARRFVDCVDGTRCVVYGDPSAAARLILDRFSTTYLDSWGGFSRI